MPQQRANQEVRYETDGARRLKQIRALGDEAAGSWEGIESPHDTRMIPTCIRLPALSIGASGQDVDVNPSYCGYMRLGLLEHAAWDGMGMRLRDCTTRKISVSVGYKKASLQAFLTNGIEKQNDEACRKWVLR